MVLRVTRTVSREISTLLPGMQYNDNPYEHTHLAPCHTCVHRTALDMVLAEQSDMLHDALRPLGAYARRNTSTWPVPNLHIISLTKSELLKNYFVSFILVPPVRHEAQAGSEEALISPPARSGLHYLQASSLNFHTPCGILLLCLHISWKLCISFLAELP